MGASLEKPPWNPLNWDPDGYYYESMSDIEIRESFSWPADPKIDKIEAYLHTDYSYLVKLDFTFAQG